ncbi:hypothetical protein B0H11DRAFT_1921098 [Mycena galericulata]|nr:hypothetical protein B0H11DRAFT_1921098 [Mycena galericulata]
MAPHPYFCADLAVESAQAVKNFLECPHSVFECGDGTCYAKKKAGMLHYGSSVKSLRPKNGQSNAAKFKLATWRRPTSPTANIVVYFQPTSSQSNDERRKRQITQVQPWESGSTYRHLPSEVRTLRAPTPSYTSQSQVQKELDAAAKLRGNYQPNHNDDEDTPAKHHMTIRQLCPRGNTGLKKKRVVTFLVVIWTAAVRAASKLEDAVVRRRDAADVWKDAAVV